MCIQVQVTTMKISYQATSTALKGDRPILEYTTFLEWSCPGAARVELPRLGFYPVRIIRNIC